MYIVTFCGHSQLPSWERDDIVKELKETLDALIHMGARVFLFGGYGEFDILCAEVIQGLSHKYSHIISILVLAYTNYRFDKSLYDYWEYHTSEHLPRKYAIPKRNQYMVDRADAVVSYVRHSGGASRTLDYAEKRHKLLFKI